MNKGNATVSSFGALTDSFSGAGHEQSGVLVVGLLAHPATIKLDSTALAQDKRSFLVMWLLILEMFLALGVIVFIMWWTLRARVDHPVKEKDADESSVKKDSKQE